MEITIATHAAILTLYRYTIKHCRTIYY